MKKILLLMFASCLVCTWGSAQALDDIVERTIMKERKVLAYSPIREADIMWEKRVWRVIDTREKMNQAFTYPGAPFFQILETSALNGDLTLYSPEDDRFSEPMTDEEIPNIFFDTDTFEIVDVETGEVRLEVGVNSINWEEVKRYRVKEVWFFDESTSTMKVRILGIAPLMDVIDENGNFRYEKALFWVYYPELRDNLAREKVFMAGNDAGIISWEDLFEMRFFSSHIYKASNVQDNRLQDTYTGIDLLLEADKIKQEIFNYEHDLWSY